jgi:hypothetical protein
LPCALNEVKSPRNYATSTAMKLNPSPGIPN